MPAAAGPTSISQARAFTSLWGRRRYPPGFFALSDLVSILPAILFMLAAGDGARYAFRRCGACCS